MPSFTMTLEEAMVYALVTEKRGMTTEQLAYRINERYLHERKDGKLVTSGQVYAAVCRNPDTFVKDGKLIRLLM